jgi:hypothetical protein
MEEEIYQILKRHRLPLKKREEILADLLLLFNVSEEVNDVGMEGHENGCQCWMCNDLRGTKFC